MSAEFVSERRWPIILLILGVGLALGLSIGWLLPIRHFTTDFAGLHPDYQADYVLMVGNAYLLDGDWPVAEARLADLNEPDLINYVGELTDRYIAAGRNLSDVRSLVSLSVQLGYISPEMEPYLAAQLPGG